MKVICINKNGWHSFRGNVYAFVEPREGLHGYPVYGKEYKVLSMFLDCYGDMLYQIEGYGSIGLDAEAFAVSKLLNSQQSVQVSDTLRFDSRI